MTLDRAAQKLEDDMPAERAYARYAKLYGGAQTLERLAERGGFGLAELGFLLRGYDRRNDSKEDDRDWQQACDYATCEILKALSDRFVRAFRQGAQWQLDQMSVDGSPCCSGCGRSMHDVAANGHDAACVTTTALLNALKQLATKIRAAFDSEAYQGQVGLAWAHGYRYHGPTVDAELAHADAVIARVELLITSPRPSTGSTAPSDPAERAPRGKS